MRRLQVSAIAVKKIATVFLVVTAWPAIAQDIKTPYPSMAPLDQYLMEREAEIALARSAAPESISKDAAVMVLGRHSYETASREKRLRVHRGAFLDVPNRRPGLLESEGACSPFA